MLQRRARTPHRSRLLGKGDLERKGQGQSGGAAAADTDRACRQPAPPLTKRGSAGGSKSGRAGGAKPRRAGGAKGGRARGSKGRGCGQGEEVASAEYSESGSCAARLCHRSQQSQPSHTEPLRPPHPTGQRARGRRLQRARSWWRQSRQTRAGWRRRQRQAGWRRQTRQTRGLQAETRRGRGERGSAQAWPMAAGAAAAPPQDRRPPSLRSQLSPDAAAPKAGALAPNAGLLDAPNPGLEAGAPKGEAAAGAPNAGAPKPPAPGEAAPVLPLHPSA